MTASPTKKCRVCLLDKEYSLLKISWEKPTTLCKECSNNINREKRQSGAYRKRENTMARRRAADPAFIDRMICVYSKKNDKKKGRQNDLTREFVKAEITKGCVYCGQMEGRITLDRIDNSIGHLMSNCVPACLRCNYIRRDIPYEAWLVMVPAIRQAGELGLFGKWDGSWPKPSHDD